MPDKWPGGNIHELIANCLDPPSFLYEGFLDRNTFTIFAFSLFYECWNFRNDRLFDSKMSIQLAAAQMDRMTTESWNILKFNLTIEPGIEESWIPPPLGEWKVNYDTAFKEGTAVLEVVVRDAFGNLIAAEFKIAKCSSAFEAEVQALVWATFMATEHDWKFLILSTDAYTIVEEVKSNKMPKDWSAGEGVHKIRRALELNNWKLVWQKRSANKLADVLAKLTLKNKSYFSFSSSNLDCLPGAFCNVYFSEIVGGPAYVFLSFVDLILCLIASQLLPKKKIPLSSIYIQISGNLHLDPFKMP